jgi:alpha/beta superfamily hydrolase
MDEAIDIEVGRAGLVLEGIWHEQPAAERAAVVAPPHPLYGGSLDNPVVVEAAAGLADAGLQTLRFNWRGVGNSGGRASGESAQADADYLAAVDCLQRRSAGDYLAAGYSFGAATAVRTAVRDERVAELLLIAPPLQMIDRTALAACSGPIHVIVGERDEYAPLAGLEALLAAAADFHLDVVAGADHFFSFTARNEIRRLARAAIERRSAGR